MVIGPTTQGMLLGLFAAAKQAVPLIEQLEPYRKVAVVMALLGIVLVGVFLVAATMLGGNWVRRLARHKPSHRTTDTSANYAAQNRRLRETLHELLPDVGGQDTVHIEQATGETKVEP